MLRDSCVYVKETMAGQTSTGETRFCFKRSSTYTAECQDSGVTGEQGIEITGEKRVEIKIRNVNRDKYQGVKVQFPAFL